MVINFSSKGKFKAVFTALLLIFFYSEGVAQSCDCPPITSCGACVGGLTSLTLRYNGTTLPAAVTASDRLGVIFAGIVNPGDTFTLTSSLPSERFVGDEINLTVNLLPDATILTACTTPVPVKATFGSFTVISGISKMGGPICCEQADMETIKPVITGCPADTSVVLGVSGCSKAVSWTAPSATDNCGTPTLTSSHSPGATFLAGTTPVTYTATDIYGNTSTCSFNVVVSDETDPVFTGCPSDIIVTANASCTATATWTIPTASDNCSTITVTSTHAPGATFPLGTTPVTYTAKDATGNISTCTFNVVVNDLTPPVISGCPSSNVVVFTSASSCNANATWTAPTASDLCSGVTLTSSHSPGAMFPLGTTTVTYTATDQAGNIASCSFNVLVKDVTAPVFTNCNTADITKTTGATCQASVTWVAPLATDNCSVTITSSHNSGDLFPTGTTVVTYTATDGSGNTTTCAFNVVVIETSDPVLVGCPSDIVVTADLNCEAIATWTPPSATDNCGATLSSTHLPGATFAIGTTPVTYTATDAAGNTETCTFNIVVIDETGPVISGCLSDIHAPANSSCNAMVTWVAPQASDNCEGVTLTSTHNPGDIFEIGLTEVVYTAEDATGNITTCAFNVIVEDKMAPVFSNCIVSDIVINAGGSCVVNVNWTPPTAVDNCSAVSITSTHAPGEFFESGSTTVTYTATDEAGNVSTCSFNVVVEDNTLPVFSSCPTSDVLAPATSDCGAVVSWIAPTVSDNCSAVEVTSSHQSGTFFNLGTTQVVYTAVDASGNISTCTFNVVVQDQNAPVISHSFESGIVVNAITTCGAQVTWDEPLTTDECTVALSSTHHSGDSFPLGLTTVTYTATDASGNESNISFDVEVKDSSAPVISGCPKDISVEANEACGARVTWTAPTAEDNCGSIDVVGSHDSGGIFQIGTTKVTYIATDAAGNITTCSFDVRVVDTTPPQVAVSQEDIILLADESCTAIADWNVPNPVDNCEIATVVTSHEPGDVFPMGATAVTYVATDVHGNESTWKFNVIVKDNFIPVITDCPSDISAKATESGEVSVDWVAPAASAKCADPTLTSSHEPGDLFSLGTTQVSYTATTSGGNTAECKFNIIVTYEDVVFDPGTVLTPDGDGINDAWLLSNIEKFKNNKVTIVDRWGGVVFSASGYNNESVVWRGENRNGVVVPTGTYFYTISVSLGPSHVEKRGFLELIR